MLRKFLLATLVFSPALVAFGVTAMAQQANNREPQTLDELVDFILRPTQEAEEDEDIWNWDSEPEAIAARYPDRPAARRSDRGRADRPAACRTDAGAGRRRDASGRAAITADRAFAAIGVNLGSFIIRPSIEIGGVATDNAGGTSDKVARGRRDRRAGGDGHIGGRALHASRRTGAAR